MELNFWLSPMGFVAVVGEAVAAAFVVPEGVAQAVNIPDAVGEGVILPFIQRAIDLGRLGEERHVEFHQFGRSRRVLAADGHSRREDQEREQRCFLHKDDVMRGGRVRGKKKDRGKRSKDRNRFRSTTPFSVFNAL